MATDAEISELLTNGDLKVVGRLVDSSNSALVVVATGGEASVQAVYKPVAGERPLWDFPTQTLSHREVATYELSVLLGWPIVPVTVWRDKGPAGPGMVQLWVDTSEVSHLIDLFAADSTPTGWPVIIEGEDSSGNDVALAHADHPSLRQLALFDVICNNADRKAGHIVVAGTQLQGIDHGLTFNTDYKLRTVLWGFAGQPIDAELIAHLRRVFAGGARLERTADHLSAQEVKVLVRRADQLVGRGTFPMPKPDRPAIPWPLF